MDDDDSILSETDSDHYPEDIGLSSDDYDTDEDEG